MGEVEDKRRGKSRLMSGEEAGRKLRNGRIRVSKFGVKRAEGVGRLEQSWKKNGKVADGD